MSISFPVAPADGTVFIHDQIVCVYHDNTNTWECRRINPQGSVFTGQKLPTTK